MGAQVAREGGRGRSSWQVVMGTLTGSGRMPEDLPENLPKNPLHFAEKKERTKTATFLFSLIYPAEEYDKTKKYGKESATVSRPT